MANKDITDQFKLAFRNKQLDYDISGEETSFRDYTNEEICKIQHVSKEKSLHSPDTDQIYHG